MSLFRRPLVLALAGVVAVLVGLAATFPARLALAWFAPPAVQAWGVEGSIWQGHAAELVFQERSLGALSWEVRPGRLLALQPAWDLDLRRGRGFAQATAGFSLLEDRQQIDDLNAALELATLPPGLVPEGLAGQARISLETIEIEEGWPTRIVGRAAVAGLELPGVILALGPFEFQFPDQPGPPAGVIRSVGGPLVVDGQIALPAAGQWRFTAELAPGENPPPELVEGLAYVGEDLGGGRRRLEMSSEP